MNTKITHILVPLSLECIHYVSTQTVPPAVTPCFYLKTYQIVHERCWEGKWGVWGEDTPKGTHTRTLLLLSQPQLLGSHSPRAPADEFLDERSRSCGKSKNFGRLLGDHRYERGGRLSDYNLERYSRLRPLRGAFPRELELGRQRRGRRLSPSPTAPAPHRPQGKRKAPEERDKARVAQLAPRHSASPGRETQSRMQTGQALQAVAASVQRAVAVAGGEVPVSRGAIEGILIKHVLDPSKYSPATYCPVEFPNSGATLRQGEVGRESWSCLWPLLQAPRQEADPLPSPRKPRAQLLGVHQVMTPKRQAILPP
uniref:Uncharacterized protein n=1 Tax=Zosterops lateralis melanops TaxID=1220523 RepID=A0A8D2NSK2_ZOSLA